MDHKLLTFGEEGEYFERVTQEKRKRYEHKIPYLEREIKQVRRADGHDVQNFGKYDACAKCGRKTQAEKQHQWAPLCRALPTFRPSLEKNHTLVLQDGDWNCEKCGRAGKWLASNCDDPPNPAGHIVIRYPHADACHVCGHFTLHTSKPVQANKNLGQTLPPGCAIPHLLGYA